MRARPFLNSADECGVYATAGNRDSGANLEEIYPIDGSRRTGVAQAEASAPALSEAG